VFKWGSGSVLKRYATNEANTNHAINSPAPGCGRSLRQSFYAGCSKGGQ
jgi:hypothetical protein